MGVEEGRPDAMQLWRQLRASGWWLYGFGDRLAPAAVGALKRHAFMSEVVFARGSGSNPGDLAAYRAKTARGDDPWAVEVIFWHAVGTPAEIGQAVMALPLETLVADEYPIPFLCRPPWRVERWQLDLSGDGG